jgi:hypothetical protein
MSNPIDPFHRKHLNEQRINILRTANDDLHSGISDVRQDDEDNRCCV